MFWFHATSEMEPEPPLGGGVVVGNFWVYASWACVDVIGIDRATRSDKRMVQDSEN